MAIKGKGRAKTGRRPVARGPRPGYVEPPKPMFKRTWFRWAADAFVLAGVVAIILAILMITASNNRKEAKAARAHTRQGRVQKYVGPVTQYLQGVAQPLPGGEPVAKQLFSDGYQKLINAQISAGLPANVFPAPAASPSPASSPQASASPSAAASAKPTGTAGGGKNSGGKPTPKPSASAS